MIHRADAQMNSYPFDCRYFCWGLLWEHVSLLVCQYEIDVSCRVQGVGENRYDMIWIWYDMIWYDMIWYDLIDTIWYDTSFKFNSSTTFAIYLGQRVHEHLPAGIHVGGRGFQWSCDSLTARATEKMRLLQLWVNIWFISILHPAEKETNSSVCETLSMSDRSRCNTCKFVFTYSLTYKVPCHLYIWCKCMQNTSTCTAFWFWLITLRAKAFKRSRMKNVGKTRFLHTSGSFKTNDLVSGRSWNTMFCSWDVRIQNDSQYQLRHHRVWISLDFPDKSQVMCRCGYKHDDMIVWTDLHQAETSFQGTIPSVIAVMSHVGVATKTWMALEESLKESDGSDTAMSFECMICHVSKYSNTSCWENVSWDQLLLD